MKSSIIYKVMDSFSSLLNSECPNGVKFYPLSELGSFYGGLTGKSKDDFKNGNAKFITYMNIFNNPALKLDVTETVRINEGERQNTIQYGDVLFTGSSETPDECGMSSVLIEKTTEKLYLNSFSFGFRFNDLSLVEPRYLKHLFRSSSIRARIAKTANGVTRFNVSKKLFAKIEIPLPPIVVQKWMADFLDVFTDLDDNLQRELEARKKQYEAYRGLLLSFDDSIETERVDVVFKMRNGYTPSKNNEEFWTNGTIPWFRMEDIRENGRILSDSLQHISSTAVKGKGLFPANSIILATSATIGEHALLLQPSLSNQRFTNFYPKGGYEKRIDMKYVYYYMFIIDEWCKGHTKQGGFASVDMDGLSKYEFPIPPMDVQNSIVEKLDVFESVIKNLEEELSLRRQQYEYYREKLLSF